MTKYQLVTTTGATASSIENRLRAMDNNTLLKFYDDSQEWLDKHKTKELDPLEIEKYKKYQALVQKIEEEGRRREIVPFIPLEIIREIFGIPEENILN